MSTKVKVIDFNAPTVNGRVYSKEAFESLDLSKEVYGAVTQDGSSIVSMTDVAVLSKDLEVRDDGVYATVTILETPQGILAKKLVESGNFTFASKGMGTTKTVDGVEVVDPNTYKLISIDLVKNT